MSNNQNKRKVYPDKEAYDYVMKSLARKGVTVDSIAEITYQLESPYIKGLTLDACSKTVNSVLKKRDVLSNIMVGLEIDRLAEENKLSEPLNSIINNDLGLFPVDEVIGTAICNTFGLIGVTNYGYVDKKKKGIIEKLDKDTEHCNTFIDDIVGAVASAAAAKVAHRNNFK